MSPLLHTTEQEETSSCVVHVIFTEAHLPHKSNIRYLDTRRWSEHVRYRRAHVFSFEFVFMKCFTHNTHAAGVVMLVLRRRKKLCMAALETVTYGHSYKKKQKNVDAYTSTENHNRHPNSGGSLTCKRACIYRRSHARTHEPKQTH